MIDCSKCPKQGICCGVFPMNKELLEEEINFQVVPNKIMNMENGNVAIITDDGICVFLNRKTKLCAIYEKRPEVCKLYGMTKHKDLQCAYFKRSGNRRSEGSQKQVQKHINKMVDNTIKRYEN